MKQLICRLSGHDWEPWTVVDYRRCTRCNTMGTRPPYHDTVKILERAAR